MSHFSYLQREKPILSNKTCHSLKWKFFPLLEKPLKHTHTPFNDSWHTLQSNLQNFKRKKATTFSEERQSDAPRIGASVAAWLSIVCCKYDCILHE